MDGGGVMGLLCEGVMFLVVIGWLLSDCVKVLGQNNFKLTSDSAFDSFFIIEILGFGLGTQTIVQSV